ncbi:hypothetical protein J3459_011851 [Metarhizium acridum]|uniref:uncharacterized protein n=1 Tax=Metarhizium acridum TaxID=92637 RepID=UPI001C6C8731|nr:hypothetical protein J3458_009545 [Metarhizium acridum]KAG8418991.1 hypothetical protein J3459_011851 [Metarhizium acridum]
MNSFLATELGPQNSNAYSPRHSLEVSSIQKEVYQQLVHPDRGGADLSSERDQDETTADKSRPLCDGRLEKLDITAWSKVPSVMMSLLVPYLYILKQTILF